MTMVMVMNVGQGQDFASLLAQGQTRGLSLEDVVRVLKAKEMLNQV